MKRLLCRKECRDERHQRDDGQLVKYCTGWDNSTRRILPTLALGQSPREAFAQGIQLAGMRTHRLIPYSEEFLILTCPTPRTGCAKLDAARGIVVNGLRCGNPLMRSSPDAGKCVEVRYDPFDMSIAYAFVEGQWLQCTADAFLQVQGHSEREWELILDEWREQRRQHHRKRGASMARCLPGFWRRF